MITAEEARANATKVREDEKEKRKRKEEQLRNEALKEVEKICDLINNASNEGFTAMEIKKNKNAELNPKIFEILREELGFTVWDYVTMSIFRVSW